MYGLLDGAAGPPPTRSAHVVLRALMSSLGASGLRAAAEHPRLLASVDQHTAAIRDGLAACGPASLAALAGYAEGVRETADAHGWRPPTGPVDWFSDDGPDWVLTRLLAVCALARSLGVTPSPARPPRAEPEREGPPAG